MDANTYYDPASRRKKRLIIASIVALTLCLIAIAIVSLNKNTLYGCFTTQDYQAFYGEQPYESNFEPTESFFQNDYSYAPGTTDILTSESDSPAIDASKLAGFYASRSQKPMTFTLSSVYASGNAVDKALAEKRIAALSDTLVKAGIPAQLIRSQLIAYTQGQDSETPDAVDSVNLTLTAAESCS